MTADNPLYGHLEKIADSVVSEDRSITSEGVRYLRDCFLLAHDQSSQYAEALKSAAEMLGLSGKVR